jgi:6-phosphofructokinase 2
MKSILTLTVNPSIDINTEIDRVVPEKKLRCAPPTFEPGGGGINVTRAIKKLGGSSKAFYIAGGATGELLGDLLTQEGLDHRSIYTATRTRESLIVFERSTERQFRFGLPGLPFATETWTDCLAQLAGLAPFPDFIVVSGSGVSGMPSDFYSSVAEVTREKGGHLVADSSGSDLKKLLNTNVFLIKPNLPELREFSGRDLCDEIDIENEAKKIVQNSYAQVVVLSIGAAGALYVTKSGQGRVRAPTVPIRSKVGAGDSMVAGIVLSLARGREIEDAVMFGVASGAAAVMTPGTELCRRNDAENLYALLKANRRKSKI